MITHAKIGGTSYGSLPFICNFILNMQTLEYVDNDVKCHLQRFVVVIQYVDKERAFQIASEYMKQMLFPLLVYAYKF